MKKNTSQRYSGPNAPIRGPEWSNAQITRTSNRVEPLSAWQLQDLQQPEESIRIKFDRCIQQYHDAICKYVPQLVRKPVQIERTIGQKAVSEKCLFAATNTDDFRKLKEELCATGVMNINNAVIVPVVGDHECLHTSTNMPRSWGPRAA
jgi:hypothetical protein